MAENILLGLIVLVVYGWLLANVGLIVQYSYRWWRHRLHARRRLRAALDTATGWPSGGRP
jgi:hypothetical protein